MTNLNFYDTSALLLLPTISYSDTYISSIVLRELENIKTSAHKDENLKFKARKIIRELILNPTFISEIFSMKELEKVRKRYPSLMEIADHYLICEALILYNEGYEINFITADACLYLLLKTVFPKLNVTYVCEDNSCETTEIWTGWGKYYPEENQLHNLYCNGNLNPLDAAINEYCLIYEYSKIKDVLRWNGSEYCHLSYKEFSNMGGERISPLNIEQKMLFDLLQNRDIKVKLTRGAYGSGKTFLMLAHALRAVKNGEFEKIVFIRNNVGVKDTKDLGSKAPLYSNI